MPKQLAVIMDPIESIKIQKDSTFAIMLEAQKRKWHVYYLRIEDLFLKDGIVYCRTRRIKLKDDPTGWHEFKGEEKVMPLHHFNAALMRKDPPFDMPYLYATILLDLAKSKGLCVVNDPQSLRDANEKLFTGWFANLCPPTLVTSHRDLIHDFLNEHKRIILKPLDSMGGQSIFFIKKGDPNLNVVLENMTKKESLPIMAQRFIPAIKKGDKRILVIDGEAFPYGLLRVPQGGDIRGNLVAGGKGIGSKLTKQEQSLCEKVGPVLKRKGILFAGLDVIGGQLTEINVTSPTCIREIDKAFNVNVSAVFMDALEKKLKVSSL